MEPEYSGTESGSEVAKPRISWKQTGYEERAAAITEEMKRMRRLPPNSVYVAHRLRLLDKIYQLLLLQKTTTSQDEELELLFSGLQL